jgi:glycogen(starch) synthase
MKHLIISREYPPSPYRSGGIGTYAENISRLLAARGETVHAIGELSPAAPRRREVHLDGRLVIHRVAVDEPTPDSAGDASVLESLRNSDLPAQAFIWQAAVLAESLVEREGIDIIEGQEYEAPLYFLMLRRALGLSRGRRVPIVVHLHSPSEFIFKYNDWDTGRSDYPPLKRLEEYTIRTADALLCPSRFLAEIAERHYNLEPRSIEVIPYPMGDFPVITRADSTWSDGAICYVGRLEPRKGVREWIDAAVSVASQDPRPRFSLIGGDTSRSGTGDTSMRDMVRSQIPPMLQARFAFIESVPRPQLLKHLAQARMVIVPSRWENFPNTCIEAMSSGLPVLASPNGGMAEMIEHERTGWIAEGGDALSLARALHQALAVPASRLAEMGQAAALSIRALCGNDQTVRRHLEFRARMVSRGARASAAYSLPGPNGTAADLQAIFPELRDSSASTLEMLLRAGLQRAPAQGSRANNARPESDHVMSPLEILRATRWQRREIARRVLADPAHVAHWVAWHGRRAVDRVRRKVIGF